MAQPAPQPAPRPLVFVLHLHQPSGNLEQVYAEAYARCYQPLLDRLARYEAIKVGLHFSGALLEWAKGTQPDLLTSLARSGRAGAGGAAGRRLL